MREERIEVAFRCGRDLNLFTSKRMLLIDRKGLTGKKVEYLTIPYPRLRAYSITTAGSLCDRDSELDIYTDINCEYLKLLHQDLKKGKADLLGINRYLSDKLLGVDPTPLSLAVDYEQGKPDEGPGTRAWWGNDMRQIDAEGINHKFHTEIPILQPSEMVEMAFKGRKDVLILTTKRFLLVDYQSILGMNKKVRYSTIPWRTIRAFGVQTAGSLMDKDAELCLWTDIRFDVTMGTYPCLVCRTWK
jgi:hypothetical protein